MPEATVLIVDDDRTIVRYCQRLLERASYHILTALDPMNGLKVLEAHRVDLLVTDIRMPVMDGFELISRAKKIQPDLPVLVMTGFGSVDTAIQALHRGVDGLILKPFENAAELVQAVQRVLLESRQKRDAARLQALRPLFGVSETLLAETSPQNLERLIMNAMTDLFQVTDAGIWSVGTSGSLEPVHSIEGHIYQTIPEDWLKIFLKMVLADGIPQVFNQAGPGKTEMQTLLRELGWESALVAPIRRNEHQFVYYASRAPLDGLPLPLPFTEADLEMFLILTRQSTVAIENARLYTELKDYVRQIEQSQRALIQAEKMAAVGRLMASLAHEINNPLQAVRNCLNLAARRNIDAEQRFNYIHLTDSELDRLVKTVRRMLDFYRAGKAEKDEIDIPALIDKVLALLASQLQMQNITTSVEYNGTPVTLSGVSDQIQQVFFNLILNSMDALETSREEKNIWVEVFYESQQVRVLVEDSGPGIAQELREHLFEPFISTKKNGTGLGLAVSYGIIERHNGRVTVITPRHKQGACFEIVLPVEVEAIHGKDTYR